jgi:hypothetical protein
MVSGRDGIELVFDFCLRWGCMLGLEGLMGVIVYGKSE